MDYIPSECFTSSKVHTEVSGGLVTVVKCSKCSVVFEGTDHSIIKRHHAVQHNAVFQVVRQKRLNSVDAEELCPSKRQSWVANPFHDRQHYRNWAVAHQASHGLPFAYWDSDSTNLITAPFSEVSIASLL